MAKTTLVQNETTPTQLNITALSSAGYATSGTQDGDPILADDINDYKGFASAVLNDNGITASGTPDTQANSQVYQGLNKKFDQIRYKTLSDAITENAPIGTRYTITDLDSARYDVVLAGDSGGLYQTGLASGRKLRYVEIAGTSKRTVPLSHLGNYAGQDIATISNAIATYLSATGGVMLYPIGTFLCSDTITLPSKVSVIGNGIGRTSISATNAMTSLKSVFYAELNYCDISDISILGNSDGTLGAGSGLHVKGSDYNITRVYVSNTTQAGIRIENPQRVKCNYNILESCGRDGYSDNHGIMLYSLGSGTYSDNEVCNNTVANTHRKGITTAFAAGTLRDLKVHFNTVYGSGLGDIYIGGSEHYDVDISHNTCYGSAVGIQFDGKESKICFNTVRDTTNDFGIGGFDLVDVEIIGNIIKNSRLSGIKIFSPGGGFSEGLTISGNIIKNSNRADSGAASIELVNVKDSMISTNNIKETSGSELASYGIYEHSACDNNNMLHNKISGVTAESYFISGANTTVEYADTSERHKGLALSNGQNNNVNVTVGAGSVTITGPTADYSITGITGGRLGRTIKLVNSTGFNLTLSINSGASTAGNRLYLTNSVDKIIPAWGTVELTYVNNQGNSFWCDF